MPVTLRYADLLSILRAAAVIPRKQVLHPLCYALQTKDISFGSFVLTGFVGWCEYQVDGSPEAQVLLRALPYMGAGYKTAQGMGAVRVCKSNKGGRQIGRNCG